MLAANPVKVYGLVVTITVGVFGVGADVPQGTIAISHWVALGIGFTQLITAEVVEIFVAVIPDGGKQLVCAAQLTLATQPACATELSLLNTNVRHPSTLVEVKGPGFVVPQ